MIEFIGAIDLVDIPMAWGACLIGMTFACELADGNLGKFIKERILPVWAYGGFGFVVLCYLIGAALTVYGGGV